MTHDVIVTLCTLGVAGQVLAAHLLLLGLAWLAGVRSTGETLRRAHLEARTIAFIGSDSDGGRRAAIVASRQNRLFEFERLLYANQGSENTGWLDDAMVTAAAKSIPGLDVQALLDTRNSAAVVVTANRYDAEANADRVAGTLALYFGKTSGKLAAFSPSNAPDVAALSAALDRAVR